MSASSSTPSHLSITPLAVVENRGRLAVAGEIDLATSGELTAALADALEGPPLAVLEVDFGGVRFLDSSGILALVRAHGRAAQQGCRLTVTDVQPTVRRVLEITGVLTTLGLDVTSPAC
ncbi:STAS domain-containing protein [Micromonospora sp. RTGN7]|uniref:STAS domain-containing protein n=1 Tax=Micromonospora sp. RTGN7 TaxID=3016526 RepID=UPI0029FEEB7B|nr:STAS domain-containing protein [Micromonospora sp. RTGN7]